MVLLEEISDDDSKIINDTDSATSATSEDEGDTHVGGDESTISLRQRAFDILESIGEDTTDLSDKLYDLLSSVIKPIFSTSKHPQLTSTGRKNLVPNPSIAGRFNYDSTFDDSRPWKNSWTADLLLTILQRHGSIETTVAQKKAIEAHFHLLVPAILNMIDDTETTYKVKGCECLRVLCQLLVRVDSDMMKRTGLTDVFVEALQKTFNYLPTLTPEDESLVLMQAVYPTFISLVDARFPTFIKGKPKPDDDTSSLRLAESKTTSSNAPATLTSTLTSTTARTGESNPETESQDQNKQADPSLTSPSMNPLFQPDTEIAQRHSLLTLLLRHSLLHSLSHLSTGTPSGTNTTSPLLTTFLISQIPSITSKMGIPATAHLQTLIPMLKNIIIDPFLPTIIGSNTDDTDTNKEATRTLLSASLKAMQTLIITCKTRIRERWWSECLSALVECWLNIVDETTPIHQNDLPSSSASSLPSRSESKMKVFEPIKVELRAVLKSLQNVMGERKESCLEFQRAREVLVKEEGDLLGLFSSSTTSSSTSTE